MRALATMILATLLAAIADITTIDVTDIEGRTVDGIHPDDAYHAALNARIRAALINRFDT